MKKIFIFLVTVSCLSVSATAQQRISKSELTAFNKNMQANPLLLEGDGDFKDNPAETKWANESAVILCQKTTFDFDKKGVSVGKRISRNFWGLLFALPTFGTSIYAANAMSDTKILVEETERRKILLNDKFAVDLYSVLYFRLPSWFAGNKAIRFNYANEKTAVEKEILPGGDTLQNAMITQINASLDVAASSMAVKKEVEAKGDLKSDMTDDILALTPFMEMDYRNYDGMGMWETVTAKTEEKLTSDFNQQKKEWKEEKPKMMKSLAAGLYNHNIDNYTNFRLLQDGRSFKKRSLKYEENFVISDVKATAGDDMLVEVPALIGSQTRLKKEERTRTLPVDLRYPRTLIWNITFAIPAGYTAKGLEALNKTVSNECGQFSTVAIVENNNLLIKVRKVFKVKSLDVQKWPLLMSIQDAAYAFSQSKLLLKKI